MRKPILTIFYQFNPWYSSIGGIQTFIRSFLKYAPSGFEVRLVGTGGPNSHVGVWQEAEFAGRSIQFLPLISLQNDDNVRNFIPTTLKYTVALLGKNFASDFMHFHRLEPTIATLKWSGEKTFFIHNDIRKQMDPTTSKNTILWRYFPAGYFALERFLIKQFSQIYSCNTEVAELYQQRYPALAKQITYLKNTVDNDIFYPLKEEEREERRKAFAQQKSLSEETAFVLFAGRLHPQKDPILLIRSFAVLNEPNVHLLIAGDGELASEVHSEIYHCGLSEQVTMLGPVAQEKLAELHRISSVFVLSSTYEGLPLVVLEALASGTPIVTTPCGETPKLLTEGTGIVCRDRTAVEIANALRQVLRYPEDYPATSCARVAQPYTARSVVSNVYTEMLQRWNQRNLLPTTAK